MNENEIHGPLSLFASAFAPAFQRPRKQRAPWFSQGPSRPATPEQKTMRRVWCGAGFLTASLWLSPVIRQQWGARFWLAPQDAPLEIWLPFALWASIALAGLVGLLAGTREASKMLPPSIMGMFWAVSLLVVIGALFIRQTWPNDALAAYAVRGLYVTAASVAIAHLFVASGIATTNAQRKLEKKIRQRNAPPKAARPRPY